MTDARPYLVSGRQAFPLTHPRPAERASASEREQRTPPQERVVPHSSMSTDLNARSATVLADTQAVLKRPHVTRRAGPAGKVHLCDAETLLPLCGRPLANGGLSVDMPVDCLRCRRRLALYIRRPTDPLLKEAKARRKRNRRRRTAAAR